MTTTQTPEDEIISEIRAGGLYHCETGPAVILGSGTEVYYLNDFFFEKENYFKKLEELKKLENNGFVRFDRHFASAINPGDIISLWGFKEFSKYIFIKISSLVEGIEFDALNLESKKILKNKFIRFEEISHLRAKKQ